MEIFPKSRWFATCSNQLVHISTCVSLESLHWDTHNLWPDLGKSTFWTQSTFSSSKTLNHKIFKNIAIFQIDFLQIWITHLIAIVSSYEISQSKLRRYGRLYQTDRCAKKVGFPRSGHIYWLYLLFPGATEWGNSDWTAVSVLNFVGKIFVICQKY